MAASFSGVISTYHSESVFDQVTNIIGALCIIAALLFMAKDNNWLVISIVFMAGTPILWVFGMMPLALPVMQ